MSGELGDFSPFGYLRNPSHRVRSWSDTSGGNLRAAPDYLGVEWVYPVGRDPTSRAGIGLETTVDGRECRTRADFDAIGLTSRYHSSSILGFDWRVDGVAVEARVFLVDEDSLCLRLSLQRVSAEARRVEVRVVQRIEGSPPQPHTLEGPTEIDTRAPGVTYTVLTRAGDDTPRRAADEAVYQRLMAEDRAFAATCPTLSGDWPAHWREGLHHDFQTTRLLVQPPAGIFRDVWPASYVKSAADDAWKRVKALFAEELR